MFLNDLLRAHFALPRQVLLSCLLQSLAWLKIRILNHFLSLCHWIPPRTKHIWVVLRMPPSWWVPQFFLPSISLHIPFSHLIFPFMNKVSERWRDKTRHFPSLIPSNFRSETCLILSGFSLGWTQVLQFPHPTSPEHTCYPAIHLHTLGRGNCLLFSPSGLVC